MPGQDAFEVEGVVIDVMPNSVVWVRLANGHRVLGHRSARMKREGPVLVAGDRVCLAISPFDLSKGRILGKIEEQTL